MEKTIRINTRSRTHEIAMIGLFAGLSAALMFIKFPLPFMPPFMDFDFTGVVEIIGGFALGPIPAILIVVIKNLLKLVLMGTGSAFTGEIQNMILGCAYVLPAVLIYQRKKTRKNAIIGMLVGTIVCTFVAILSNLYFIIPFYGKLYGLGVEEIVAMCHAVNPLVTGPWQLALWGIVPFNIFKNGLCSIIAFFAYKRISKPVKNFIK